MSSMAAYLWSLVSVTPALTSSWTLCTHLQIHTYTRLAICKFILFVCCVAHLFPMCLSTVCESIPCNLIISCGARQRDRNMSYLGPVRYVTLYYMSTHTKRISYVYSSGRRWYVHRIRNLRPNCNIASSFPQFCLMRRRMKLQLSIRRYKFI